MTADDLLQQLWDEHRVSAHLLRVIAAQESAVLAGDAGALSVVRDIVRRERDYGDRVHHAREELLFGRLAARSAAGAEAVHGLTREHEDIARKGATVLESLEAFLAHKPEDPDVLRQRLDDYVDTLSNHMHKEEQRVFPLAPQVLLQEDWEVAAQAYAHRTDPLAPPVEPDYRALAAWLADHDETPY